MVDPVLDPVADPALDPARDPAARPVADPASVAAAQVGPVVGAVVEVRNRFGVGGPRDLVRLAEAEIVAAERAIADLDLGS